jgi:hypothetical protein
MDPLKRLPPFKRWPALGNEINKIIDRLNAQIVRGGPGIRATQTSAGVCIEMIAQTSATTRGGRVKLFEIQDASPADYLSCKEITFPNGVRTLSDETTWVAKPAELRAVPGNGLSFADNQTRTRNVAIGSFPNVAIEEEMVKPYAAGNEIVAVELTQGTSVTAVNEDAETVNLTWEDVNADARHWRLKLKIERVCVKVNGVDTVKYIAVYSIEPFS